MEKENFYSKEFVCGKTAISRDLLETLPSPFDTENVSDKTMQEIANEVESEMKDFYEWEKNGSISHEKANEKWWELLECSIIKHNIPYYYE